MYHDVINRGFDSVTKQSVVAFHNHKKNLPNLSNRLIVNIYWIKEMGCYGNSKGLGITSYLGKLIKMRNGLFSMHLLFLQGSAFMFRQQTKK